MLLIICFLFVTTISMWSQIRLHYYYLSLKLSSDMHESEDYYLGKIVKFGDINSIPYIITSFSAKESCMCKDAGVSYCSAIYALLKKEKLLTKDDLKETVDMYYFYTVNKSFPEIKMAYTKRPLTADDRNIIDRLVKMGKQQSNGLATHVLSFIGDKNIASDLIEELNNPESPQASIIHALWRIKATSAIPIIRRFLVDDDSLVKNSAILALGMLGDAESVPIFVRILEGEKTADYIRRTAAKSLTRIGAKSSIDAIIQFISDPQKKLDT